MNFTARLVLTLSLLCSFAVSQGATSKNQCTPIDLRDQTQGANRNQGEVAWCYAFASADLLAHHFGLYEKISAADIAVRYNQHPIPALFKPIADMFSRNRDPEQVQMQHQTGFAKIAIDRALSDGYCPENVFPSEKWAKLERTENGQFEKKMVTLKQAMLDIYQLGKMRNELSLQSLPYYYELANVSADSFVSIVKQYDSHKVFEQLRKQACLPYRQSFTRKPKVVWKLKSASSFHEINLQFDRGHPVIIDYDSRLLDNAAHSSIGLSNLHTSLLVGRQWNEQTQKCEYLIRDSYGNQCDYDPSYRCEAGNVWISEELIVKNLVSTVLIKE